MTKTYAIISLGGKQHRVQEGERLLVDRLPYGEGKTFHPDVLLLGGDGEAELAPKGVQVTAKVVGHVLGEKIRIGKYKRRTGYKRHNGYRSRLSQVEIEAIGKKAPAKPKTEPKPKAEAEKPAEKKPQTRKPAARKDES
jgi:large subunit ribosomal protein L21